MVASSSSADTRSRSATPGRDTSCSSSTRAPISSSISSPTLSSSRPLICRCPSSATSTSPRSAGSSTETVVVCPRELNHCEKPTRCPRSDYRDCPISRYEHCPISDKTTHGSATSREVAEPPSGSSVRGWLIRQYSITMRPSIFPCSISSKIALMSSSGRLVNVGWIFPAA